MQNEHTHLTVLLDRTGSMESIRDDTIGGFNAFLSAQQSTAGKASLTLVQFDSQDPYEVIHHFQPITAIPPLTRETFVPRATTPLLDALGRGINDLEASLARLGPAERPGKVVFVVVTDGQENASTEFRKEQIKKMIEERTEKDQWQFVFLSADLAAMGDAESVGIQHDASLHFDKNSEGTAAAWESLSSSTTAYRSAQKRRIGFAEEDRKTARPTRKKEP